MESGQNFTVRYLNTTGPTRGRRDSFLAIKGDVTTKTNSCVNLGHLAGWITALLDYLKTYRGICLFLLGLFGEIIEIRPLVYLKQTLGGE